jgi:uncharacterized membrane protein YczE
MAEPAEPDKPGRPIPAAALLAANPCEGGDMLMDIETFWPRERPAARLTQLVVGLGLYGLSEALMLRPGVGVDPWDVFHTGLARITGISVGNILILVGFVVLLLWIPLRQRPGLGTAANVAIIGSVIDLILNTLPMPHGLWMRWAMFLSGVALSAVATGLYIGAGLGPGPRDGLTTGIADHGHSIRVARTGIEVSVLVLGWLLGGNVGLGTLVYGLAIGPLVHVTIPRLSGARRRRGAGSEVVGGVRAAAQVGVAARAIVSGDSDSASGVAPVGAAAGADASSVVAG